MKSADLLKAIDGIIASRLMLASSTTPTSEVPTDLDLEAAVISARWCGAEIPSWFDESQFYSAANRAIFQAVDAIIAAGHTPTPALISRAIGAAGGHVHGVEGYALDLYAQPYALDVYEACARLRGLALRRAALMKLRVLELQLVGGDEPAIALASLELTTALEAIQQ